MVLSITNNPRSIGHVFKGFPRTFAFLKKLKMQTNLGSKSVFNVECLIWVIYKQIVWEGGF